MSQIEKQIANSLFDSNGTSSGASDCYKIALEHMKCFAEWVDLSGWTFTRSSIIDYWINLKGGAPISTVQLIKKYLEHLETIK